AEGHREGQEGGGRRRSSALNENRAPGRRRSTKVSLAGGGENMGRRRSSVALAAISDQGTAGRKGSIFEGMQVYTPAETSAAENDTSSRRRSTRK
ncbi:unnamed protein product, partial [Ectocarpus sp. 4 AP-2014]